MLLQHIKDSKSVFNFLSVWHLKQTFEKKNQSLLCHNDACTPFLGETLLVSPYKCMSYFGKRVVVFLMSL